MISTVFLAWESPFPPLRGEHYRAAGLICGLAALGPVTLVVFSRRSFAGTDETIPPKGVYHFPSVFSPAARTAGGISRPLFPLGSHLYWSPAVAASLRRKLSQTHFDLAVCYQLRTAYYSRCVHASMRVLELTDSLALYRQNAANIGRARRHLSSPVAASHVDAMCRSLLWAGVGALEKALPEEFDVTWLSAPEDLHHIRDVLGARGPLALVPQGCFPPASEDANDLVTRRGGRPRRLLFLGDLSYPPNRDAVVVLAREIRPAMDRLWNGNAPEIWVAGRGWPEAPRLFPALRFLGYVKELASLSPEVDLGLNPTRFGSGASSKVIEGWRLGLPVISSRFGARGYTPGPALRIAETPDDFAETMQKMLTDPTTYRTAVGDTLARCRQNTWEKVVRQAVHALNGGAV